MTVLAEADQVFVGRYFQRLTVILSRIDYGQVAALLGELRAVYRRGGTAWFFGNGGKAAISAEFANDLSGGVDMNPAFRGLSLSANVPMLTALANDHAYEEVFSRQIGIYARPGDLCVGMSGSGHSLNVLDGLRAAYGKGIRTVGIVGMDGGRMITDYRQYIDVLVHIPSKSHEDGPIEDSMLMLCHLCVMRFREEA